MTKTMLDFAESKYKLYIATKDEPEDIDAVAILGFEAIERYIKHIHQCVTGTPENTHNLKKLCQSMQRMDIYAIVAPIKDMYFERNYPNEQYYDLTHAEFQQLAEIVETIHTLAHTFVFETLPISNAF